MKTKILFIVNLIWLISSQNSLAQDVNAPTVASLSPVHEATEVHPKIGEITITFDENVMYNSEPIYGFYLRDLGNTIYKTFDLSSEMDAVFVGNTLTLYIPDLESETTYWINANSVSAISDLAGNNLSLGAFNTNGDWKFTTADIADPAIGTLIPADDTENYEEDYLIIDFDDQIALETGTLEIKYAGGGTFASYTIPSSTEVYKHGTNATRLVVLPENGLPAGSDLYVTISAGAITDEAGNDFAGISDVTTWNFTTIDNIAPTTQGFTPFHGSTYGVLSATSSVNFSEDMQEGSGTVSLYKSDDTLVESITTGVGDSRIGFPALWRITFDFDTDLEELQDYYITISVGAFEDLAGNDYAGIGTGEWGFTANARPHIASLSPADGNSNVALGVTFSLNYDMAVWGTSDAALLIKDYDTDVLIETIDIADVETETGIIEFSPTSLTNDLHAYIVLEGAEMIASSNNGEKFIGLNDKDDWDFTTVAEDNTAPSIVSITPLSGSRLAQDQKTFVIEFDEPIQGNTDNKVGVYQYENDHYWYDIGDPSAAVIDGNTLTMTYPYSWINNRKYYVLMDPSTISDAAGNYFDGLQSKDDWTFTGDTDGPNIVSKVPVQGAVEISPSEDIVITYDEEIAAGTGDFQILNIAGDVLESIATSQADFTDNILTITPSILDEKTTYRVVVPDTFVEDALGHQHDGISFGNWNFTTGDETAPTLLSLSPEDDATNVAIDANFSAVFDEDIKLIESDQIVVLYRGSIVDRIIEEGDARLSISGSELGIDFTTDLLPGTDYSIWIKSTLSDLSDNYYTAHDQFTSWNFTTAKGDQSITIEPVADKLITDEDFDIVASTTSGLDLTYEVTGPATIDGTTVSLTGETGTVTVTVSQAGNETYHPASEQVSFSVTEPGKSDQTITFDAISDKIYGDATFTINATASSTLAVTYSVVSGPVTLDENMVAITGAGEVTIAADQAGDDNFKAASQQTQSFTIEKADQTITFDAIADKTYGDASFSINAMASSTLDVTYSVISGPVT
ncbi:MAG: Ig-like domain-containing protein, partial [Reichenbachiella sp.]